MPTDKTTDLNKKPTNTGSSSSKPVGSTSQDLKSKTSSASQQKPSSGSSKPGTSSTSKLGSSGSGDVKKQPTQSSTQSRVNNIDLQSKPSSSGQRPSSNQQQQKPSSGMGSSSQQQTRGGNPSNSTPSKRPGDTRAGSGQGRYEESKQGRPGDRSRQGQSQQNDMRNSGSQRTVDDIMKSVADYLKKSNLMACLHLFATKNVNKKVVVEFDAFCKQMNKIAGVSNEENFKLSNKYMIKDLSDEYGTIFIDIVKFEEDIRNVLLGLNLQPDMYEMFKKKKEVSIETQKMVDEMIQVIKFYTEKNNIHIQKLFDQFDLNNDGVITPLELKSGLEMIGMKGITKEQADHFVETYDRDASGNLDIVELDKILGTFLNQEAVISKEDPLYFIFERIRHFSKSQNQNVSQIFNVNLTSYNRSEDTAEITKAEFQRGLDRMKIMLNQNMQEKLMSRLDPRNSGKIDFKLLRELIGVQIDIGQQSKQYEENSGKLYKMQGVNHRQVHETNKALYKIKDLEKLDYYSIQLLFKPQDQNNKGAVDRKDVSRILSNIFMRYPTINVDMQLIDRMIDSQGDKYGMIDYNQFARNFDENMKIQANIEMIFKSISERMVIKGETTLISVFKNYDPTLDERSGQLDSTQLKKILPDIGIYLNDTEINEIVEEFDFDNKKALSFEPFSLDFYEFKQNEHKLFSPQMRKDNSLYRDFQKMSDLQSDFFRGDPDFSRAHSQFDDRTNPNMSRNDFSFNPDRTTQQKPLVGEIKNIIQDISSSLCDSRTDMSALLRTANPMYRDSISVEIFERQILNQFARVSLNNAQFDLLLEQYEKDGMKGTFYLIAFLKDVKSFIPRNNYEKTQDIEQALTSIQKGSQDQHEYRDPGTTSGLAPRHQLFINNNKLVLQEILDAINERKSGVFRHFNQQANRGVLRLNEWNRALQGLNVPSLTMNTRLIGDMFHELDVNQQGVDVNELEEIFKALKQEQRDNKNRYNSPDVRDQPFSKKNVMEMIAKAINGDSNFVRQGLSDYDKQKRGSILIVDFVAFFKQSLPTYSNMRESDLQLLAESYKESGYQSTTMNYMNFYIDFDDISRQIPGLTQKYSGRQEKSDFNRQYGNQGNQMNPLMPGSSPDQTKAALDTTIQKPIAFLMNTEQSTLEEIIKGCAVAKYLVEDYFEPFKLGNGYLRKPEFQRAINQLGLQYDGFKTDSIFSDIDIAFDKNMQRGELTAKQIDQALHWEVKNNLDQIDTQILKDILQLILQSGQDLKNEIMKFDQQYSGVIELADLIMILQQHMRMYKLSTLDIKYIARKYEQSGMIQYNKLLQDLDHVKRGQFDQSEGNMKVAEYIKKGVKARKHASITSFFKSQTSDVFDIYENSFVQIVGTSLGLEPKPCSKLEIVSFFASMTKGNSKAPMVQIETFVESQCKKDVSQLKLELLKKVKDLSDTRNIVLQHLFQAYDVYQKKIIPYADFVDAIHSDKSRQSLGLLRIDAEFLAEYYNQAGQCNYSRFIMDIERSSHNLKEQQNRNIEILKPYLEIINNHVKTNNLQISNYFSAYEGQSGSGVIKKEQFRQGFNLLKLNPRVFPDAHFQKIFDAYTVQNQPMNINYRQFLQDLAFLKTNDQNSVSGKIKLPYDMQRKMEDLKRSIQKEMNDNLFVAHLKENDRTDKGYITALQIQEAFEKINQRIDKGFLQQILSVLEQNSQKLYNYRTLIVHIFGEVEGGKMYLMDLKLLRSLAETQQANQSKEFRAPKQVNRPANNMLGSIGKKFIQSNKNYESLFINKIGKQRATVVRPRISEKEVIEVMRAMNIEPSKEEFNALQDFMRSSNDKNNTTAIYDILRAIGLDCQTIGKVDRKSALKVLSKDELMRAQKLVKDIRIELSQIKKMKPQEFFDALKQTQSDKYLSPELFRQELSNSFSLTFTNQKLSPKNMEILIPYLSGDKPGVISYKRMYDCFDLPDNKPPIPQEGAEEQNRYKEKVMQEVKDKVNIIPEIVLDLVKFMDQQDYQIDGLFNLQKQKKGEKKQIKSAQFRDCLQRVGFDSKDWTSLLNSLSSQGTVDLDKLQQYMNKYKTYNQGNDGEKRGQRKKMTDAMLQKNLERFSKQIKDQIIKISSYLQREKITIKQLHKDMDLNQDGYVDKKEFIQTMRGYDIPNLEINELGSIFEALDINNDNNLSVTEFGLYLQGAQLTKQQKFEQIDQNLIKDMQHEIDALFNMFDENGDGVVTPDEIQRALMSLGQQHTLEYCKDMVRSVDKSGKKTELELSKQEFANLMLPIMKDELVSQEDDIDELRALFLEADTDYSGFLSVEEVYQILQKMGAEVTLEDLIDLLAMYDVDQDMNIDIDEFIHIMNKGDDIASINQQTKNTLMNIKKSRKLNATDFLKAFKNMPTNYVKSFIQEKWVKNHQLLPSQCFKAWLDPKTMLWDDLLPALSENTKGLDPKTQPHIRAIQTQIGCVMEFMFAEGVSLPSEGSAFDRNQIVKRAIRVAVYDNVKEDFIGNSVQVNCSWKPAKEDYWEIDNPKTSGTNPIIFRSTQKHDLSDTDHCLIFELTLYVKQGSKVNEISCGWCQLGLDELNKAGTKVMEIKGGTPNSEMVIKESDVHTKRAGLFNNILNTKIKSQLKIKVIGLASVEKDVKFHMDFLPSTCLVHKRLVHFLSGYRNTVGRELFKASFNRSLSNPQGNVILSTFPKIYDSPDIMEQLIPLWTDNVMKDITQAAVKMQIQHFMEQSSEYIKKLYPLFYSYQYKYEKSHPTDSACGDHELYDVRKQLIEAAIMGSAQVIKKQGDSKAVQTSSKQDKKSFEELSTFKPFNIMELEFEVQDTKKQKSDMYARQYDTMGLQNNQNVASSRGTYVR